MLYIDPDACIDCALCVDECPVNAIFIDDELRERWQKYVQINADWYSQEPGAVIPVRRPPVSPED